MSIAHVQTPRHFIAARARLPARDHMPVAHAPGRVEEQNALAAVDGETPKDLLWLGRLLCLASSAVTLALVAVVLLERLAAGVPLTDVVNPSPWPARR